MSRQDLFSNKNSSEQRYCICEKSEDELNDQDDFMIECDGCNGWFHGQCVSLPDRIADDIEKYFCMQCSKQYGPSIFKQRKNQHRRDFSDGNAEHKAIQSGTKDFIDKLKRKIFSNFESVVIRLKGNQLTNEYLLENGFTKPILITNRDGLDLTLPSRTIRLEEINELVGHDRYVDVIDCEKQVTYKMSLDNYVEYFESYDRNKIYNVLSLEVSNTKLADSVITPKIVRYLSWATSNIWPNKKKDEELEDDVETKEVNQIKRKVTWPLQSAETSKKRRTISSSTDTDQSDDDEDLIANHFENFERPEVAKYCLMSPQSSYTDFHIDFGGSSVWYSVVRGEKIFYLIEPTDENLQKYADWSKSPNESETFLGDCVSHCYKMHLREENTVFIPAGWIHAVYTVTDSLVFGGNFLQSMGIDMQFRIYELERLAQVPHKFKYPLFETFHWYAAKTFYDELKECNNSNSSAINPITQQASESIIYHMNRWLTADKRYQIRNRYIIPKGINCEKLLRDLSRELEISKGRCGSSNDSKSPSKTIITSPIKVILPLDNKREFVQIGGTKITIKCRRLPSDSESSQNTELTVEHGVKLTLKTSVDGDRKGSNKRNLLIIKHKKKNERSSSLIKQKKNRFKHRDSSKITYTLDLEAKRQRFIQASNIQSFINETESTNDTTISSASGESPIDDIESRDNHEVLLSMPSEGLASFVKKSILDNDYYKDNGTKQERRSSEQKSPSLKKSKSKSSDTDKTNKKTDTNTSKTLPSTISKPSIPTKNPSKDRLGKILKIANSIKSRGGLLT